MSMMEIANALVAHCKNGTEREALDTLYASDAVSVEAMPSPDGNPQETKGIEGIRGKHDWWDNAMEQVKVDVKGPYPHQPNKFALLFQGSAVMKETGDQFPMDEVAVYTVEDGKIIREEFFYSM